MEAGLVVGDHAVAAARAAARRLGLSLEGGILRTAPAPLDEVDVEVIRLANAAREIAEIAFAASRRHERATFRDRVLSDLHRIFESATVQAHGALRGFSEETLRFDWLVALSEGRQLALDTPLPEHSSVAAVVVRQVDLAAGHPDKILQAIAYDERDEWPSSALRQLQLARVPVIAADSLEPALRRLTGEKARHPPE